MRANVKFRVSLLRLMAFCALCAVAFAPMQAQTSSMQDKASHSLTSRALAPQIVEPRHKSFSGIVTVKFVDPDPRCTIYYTTDGSDPLISGLTYTGPFSVKRGTRVRAVTEWPGHLSSNLISRTFR